MTGRRRARKPTPFMALALLLAGCAGNGEAGPSAAQLEVGQDVRLEGRVLEIDATPMFVDGDGEIRLRADPYGNVLVRIPAGERLCRSEGLATFLALTVGDSVRAVGRVTAPGELTVCEEDTHLLDKVE